jgi:predicted transcriptional regulator
MAFTNPHPVRVDDAGLIAAVKQAALSLDAGKSVPYADVRAWIMSWGTKQELPKLE